MPFALSVLGSGSLGNSTLLRLDVAGRRRWLLIDVGISPRQTARRLEPLGVTVDDVDGILLTHLGEGPREKLPAILRDDPLPGPPMELADDGLELEIEPVG